MMQLYRLRLNPVITFFLVWLFSVTIYVTIEVSEFHINHAAKRATELANFAERAVSVYQADPKEIESLNHPPLANRSQNFSFVVGIKQLKRTFPSADIHSLKLNQPSIIKLSYNGLLNAPDYTLILPKDVGNSDTGYAYLTYKTDIATNSINLELYHSLQPVIVLSLIVFTSLLLLFLYRLSSANSNINKFTEWTSQLNVGKQIPPPPEFTSSKLNYMAFAINKNLSGISNVLDEELSFAKYTSHELRTPITVLSTNIELLELMMQDLSPKERSVLTNMESAISDMRYQMETLLWLSKENFEDLNLTDCNLKEIVEKSIEDNQFLIKNKNIKISIYAEPEIVRNHYVALLIMINNLIRNAFQHSQEADITITIQNHRLKIVNQDKNINNPSESSGFGIGLVIVDKLAKKLGIEYQVKKLNNGREVSLKLA